MPRKNKAPAPAEAVEQKADATEDQKRAADKRAAALKGRDNDAEYIGALLVERRGYVTRGLDDRVAQVDEQIRLRGGEVPKD